MRAETRGCNQLGSKSLITVTGKKRNRTFVMPKKMKPAPFKGLYPIVSMGNNMTGGSRKLDTNKQ
jgi:hypothetical protein